MLNREVCFNCGKHLPLSDEPFEYEFRYAWNRGYWWCRKEQHKYGNKAPVYRIAISQEPPKDCPFILEQVVNA